MKKYVVSKTRERSLWRDTTIIREEPVEAVRRLKAGPGKNIISDGSSQLLRALLKADLVDELHLLVYPIVLGSGKKLLPEGTGLEFTLTGTDPYPTGVAGRHYRP